MSIAHVYDAQPALSICRSMRLSHSVESLSSVVMEESPASSMTPRIAGWRRRVATGGVLMGLVVAAFEGTVVTSAMPTIVRELGGMAAYAWVFSAFLLASTLAVLVCGKLADAFGRRPVFVAGMALFLAGSALCGASTTFAELVAFRVLQGLGAGAIQPVAMVISADIYTLEERAKIQGLFNAAWGVANVVGPIMGGWIVMHASWRWVFLVNVPVGVLAAALVVVSYRDPARTKRGPIGAQGALLAGAAVALASLAVEAHDLSRTIRLGVVGVAAAAVWLLVQHERHTERPILPAAAVRHPAVAAGLVAGGFVGAMLYTCSAYIPLWMSAHGGHDALASGLALMPLLVGWALGSSFGVKVLVRRGMRTSVGGGFALASAGALLLVVTVARGLPLWLAFAAMALLGFGTGPAASSSLVAAQSSVAWRYRGAVTSAVYATRMLGGSLAVTALGTLGNYVTDVAVARFSAIATLALGATTALLMMAPKTLSDRVGEPAAVPAE
jgi:predicted MFS family arabinose efflux permease